VTFGSSGVTKNPLAGFGADERVCLATTIEGTTKKSTLVPADCRHDMRGDSQKTHQVRLIMRDMLANARFAVKDLG